MATVQCSPIPYAMLYRGCCIGLHSKNDAILLCLALEMWVGFYRKVHVCEREIIPILIKRYDCHSVTVLICIFIEGFAGNCMTPHNTSISHPSSSRTASRAGITSASPDTTAIVPLLVIGVLVAVLVMSTTRLLSTCFSFPVTLLRLCLLILKPFCSFFYSILCQREGVQIRTKLLQVDDDHLQSDQPVIPCQFEPCGLR